MGGKSTAHPDPIDLAVSARIRARRLELGMTKTELANSLGLTSQQVGYYERGHTRVSGSTLVQVAAALGVSVAFLVGEGDDLTTGRPVFHQLATYGADDLLDAFARIREADVRKALVKLAKAFAGSGRFKAAIRAR